MRNLMLITVLGLVVGLILRVALDGGSAASANPSNPDDIVDPADWKESLSYVFREVYDGATLTSEEDAVTLFDDRYVGERTKTRTVARLTTLSAFDQMMGTARAYGFRGNPEANQPVWVIAATIDGGVSPQELGLGMGTDRMPGVYVALNAGNGEPLMVSFLDNDGDWLSKVEALVAKDLVVEPAPRLVP